MTRRVHVPVVQDGETALSASQSHHVRDVLRVAASDIVEVFDDSGKMSRATVIRVDRNEVRLRVDACDITAAPRDSDRPLVTIASAVPKGGRADWMVEKLSELGAAEFVPLSTNRGVVKPAGLNKPDRWRRIASESAQQCRRLGVMRIEPIVTVADALARAAGESAISIWLTPHETARPIAEVLDQYIAAARVTMFVGPEGGWDDLEAIEFEKAGALAARFGRSILRTETAAIAAACAMIYRPRKA